MKRKPWKKNLYENEGYEDNYTDPTFLKELQTNLHIKTYTYGEAYRGASRLCLQISCVTLFLLIFYFLYMDIITPQAVLIYSSLATIFGYLWYIGRDMKLSALIENSRTGICVLVFGYIFSPLLHTLTDSISTDTIFSTTVFVMFLHLVFFDYGISAFIVSKAISLNAAFFGSICLASRLASSFHAFVLLTVSAEFFALSPILIEKYWRPWWLVPMTGICTYLLYRISKPVMLTYLLFLIFLNLICPYIFVKQQKHKYNIHGPWDEAIVDDPLDEEAVEKKRGNI